jgi:tRNA threonylcarbamoyladenosine biosynthesis protein TsaB
MAERGFVRFSASRRRELLKVSRGKESLILSIETATRAGSISVSRGRNLLSSRTGDASRSHSTDLLDLIREALMESGHSVRDVELFAVALGPGSFTGLRIGVATAKSLASTLERKVVGVPTLHAVALSAGACERVVALLPAGRGELFAQSFRVEEPDRVTPLDEATHIAPAALLEKLRGVQEVRWAGEGAHAQREKIREAAAAEGVAFREEHAGGESGPIKGWTLAALPENLAAYVGLLALEKEGRGLLSAPEDIQAIYVRLSDAELKEKCRT